MKSYLVPMSTLEQRAALASLMVKRGYLMRGAVSSGISSSLETVAPRCALKFLLPLTTSEIKDLENPVSLTKFACPYLFIAFDNLSFISKVYAP